MLVELWRNGIKLRFCVLERGTEVWASNLGGFVTWPNRPASDKDLEINFQSRKPFSWQAVNLKRDYDRVADVTSLYQPEWNCQNIIKDAVYLSSRQTPVVHVTILRSAFSVTTDLIPHLGKAFTCYVHAELVFVSAKLMNNKMVPACHIVFGQCSIRLSLNIIGWARKLLFISKRC